MDEPLNDRNDSSNTGLRYFLISLAVSICPPMHRWLTDVKAPKDFTLAIYIAFAMLGLAAAMAPPIKLIIAFVRSEPGSRRDWISRFAMVALLGVIVLWFDFAFYLTANWVQ